MNSAPEGHVVIRTPGSSNGHKINFINCGKATVDKTLTFEKADATEKDTRSIVLIGENTAGHFRKGMFRGKPKTCAGTLSF